MITLNDLDAIDDPRELFRAASAAMDEYRRVVDMLAAVRMRAAGALSASGLSNREIAQEIGISAPRVGQLVALNDDEVMDFFRTWVQLDNLLELVGSTMGVKASKAIVSEASVLRADKNMEPKVLSNLEQLWAVRNDLLHGRGGVKALDLADLSRKAGYVSTRLVLWLQEQGVRVAAIFGPASAVASSDLTARLEVERRHDDLAPILRVEYGEAEHPVTHVAGLWATLHNQANRGYDFIVEVEHSSGGTSDIGRGHIDPLGTTKIFVANSLKNIPRKLTLRFKSDQWDYPCPCLRPNEYGHWAQTRSVQFGQ